MNKQKETETNNSNNSLSNLEEQAQKAINSSLKSNPDNEQKTIEPPKPINKNMENTSDYSTNKTDSETSEMPNKKKSNKSKEDSESITETINNKNRPNDFADKQIEKEKIEPVVPKENPEASKTESNNIQNDKISPEKQNNQNKELETPQKPHKIQKNDNTSPNDIKTPEKQKSKGIPKIIFLLPLLITLILIALFFFVLKNKINFSFLSGKNENYIQETQTKNQNNTLEQKEDSQQEQEQESEKQVKPISQADPALIKTKTVDESSAWVDQCRICFWNVKPPISPVEQLKQETQNVLEDIKQKAENGENFSKLCEQKKQELTSQNSDYTVAFEENIGNDSYNSQNEQLKNTAKTMNIGEYEIAPVYDGEYLDDDIEVNDDIYISCYYLIKRIK